MNLSDLIRRKDRSVELQVGNVTPTVCVSSDQRLQAVILDAGTRLILSSAHEFTSLRTFPSEIGWQLIGDAGSVVSRWRRNAPASLKIRLISHCDRRSHVLFSGAGGLPVRLDWPLWQGGLGEYDLELEAGSHTPVVLTHGRLFDSAKILLPVLRGSGAEVGPGANPFLRSDSERALVYVESTPAEEWRRLYEKGQSNRPRVDAGLWARYVVGDARTIDCCEPSSLDFIFSKHVFEHLINPLQVIENWVQKLRPGGVIAGVIPDLRYTFDLRQPPSATAQWIAEYEQMLSEIPLRAYERWCRYTAPYNTPDDLIARKYSIHVHYYTPENIVDLFEILRARSAIRSFGLKTSPNHKDFAFVAWT